MTQHSLPVSTRGAPEHLKSSIRRRQNAKSARRARLRRKGHVAELSAAVQSAAFRIRNLEHYIDSLTSAFNSSGLNASSSKRVSLKGRPGIKNDSSIPSTITSTVKNMQQRGKASIQGPQQKQKYQVVCNPSVPSQETAQNGISASKIPKELMLIRDATVYPSIIKSFQFQEETMLEKTPRSGFKSPAFAFEKPGSPSIARSTAVVRESSKQSSTTTIWETLRPSTTYSTGFSPTDCLNEAPRADVLFREMMQLFPVNS